MSELTESTREAIDAMDYMTLLHRWRFEPYGSPWFEGEVGCYMGLRMIELKRELGPAKAAEISKLVGHGTRKREEP